MAAKIEKMLVCAYCGREYPESQDYDGFCGFRCYDYSFWYPEDAVEVDQTYLRKE